MMKLNLEHLLTPTEAKAQGYRQLTTEYHLPKEEEMLASTVADLKRGDMPYVLVKRADGIEVWRKARKAA